jgi:hypothetical protein
MRIYIAGPMTGIPEYNYPAFMAATEQLEALGHVALNPANHDISGEIKSWQYYMRHGLRLLLDADAIAVLPGWEGSRGASLEVKVAQALEMEVKPITEWMGA